MSDFIPQQLFSDKQEYRHMLALQNRVLLLYQAVRNKFLDLQRSHADEILALPTKYHEVTLSIRPTIVDNREELWYISHGNPLVDQMMALAAKTHKYYRKFHELEVQLKTLERKMADRTDESSDTDDFRKILDGTGRRLERLELALVSKYARKRRQAMNIVKRLIDAGRVDTSKGVVDQDKVQFMIPPSNVTNKDIWQTYKYGGIGTAVNIFRVDHDLIKDMGKRTLYLNNLGKRIIDLQPAIRNESDMTIEDLLIENNDPTDPFDKSHATPYYQWKGKDATDKSLHMRKIRLENQLNAKIGKAVQDGLLLTLQSVNICVQTIRNNREDFEVMNGPFSSRYYALKTTLQTNSDIAKIFELSKKYDRISSKLANPDRAKHEKALLTKAGGDYIRIKQGENPRVIIQPHELTEDIPYYDNSQKKRWLANPVKFGDDPKYAGSPEHYDWKGSTATEFFQASDWLDSFGMKFQKVFAAEYDGKPWIVAVAGNHGLVWQIREGKRRVYLYGELVTSMDRLLSGYRGQGELILKKTITELDATGKKVTPTQTQSVQP